MPAAPVLSGGTFPELTNSWPYWHSLATKAGGATGKAATLPNPPAGPALVPSVTLTGMSLIEGPGSAYAAERGNTVAYAMSQQQNSTVAVKPNPFQY